MSIAEWLGGGSCERRIWVQVPTKEHNFDFEKIQNIYAWGVFTCWAYGTPTTQWIFVYRYTYDTVDMCVPYAQVGKTPQIIYATKRINVRHNGWPANP